VVDLPALDVQQLSYLPIALAAICLSQSNHGQAYGIIIVLNRLVFQRRMSNAHDPACSSLRCVELLPCMNDGLTLLLLR